tara:strand:+ start:701 stop:1036 length:336 start_codon:yes stop_codon:yes gene_type:complete
MGVTPGLYSPKVYRRVDWSQELILQDNGGTAINLTNSVFTAQAWDEKRSKKYCDMTCNITDAANGKLTVSMTEAQTTILPDLPSWDLKRTNGSDTEYWLTGQLQVQEGYTS